MRKTKLKKEGGGKGILDSENIVYKCPVWYESIVVIRGTKRRLGGGVC